MSGLLLSRVLSRLSRVAPAAYWRGYARQARLAGLTELRAVLSFDCDTPEDAEAAAALDGVLRPRGIPPVYAVPGAELRRRPDVYGALARQGASFLNHGSLPHAERRGPRYWSVTFYHELSPAAVVTDIERGHADVAEVTGRAPSGFRAPHFGLFQRPAQLALLYTALARMGYRYASTTMPLAAVLRGPRHRTTSGIVEFPVTGSFDRPLEVLDSWSNIVSPEEPRVRETYAAALLGTARALRRAGVPALLNLYLDPAHVHGVPDVLSAFDALLADGIRFTDYEALMTGVTA